MYTHPAGSLGRLVATVMQCSQVQGLDRASRLLTACMGITVIVGQRRIAFLLDGSLQFAVCTIPARRRVNGLDLWPATFSLRRPIYLIQAPRKRGIPFRAALKIGVVQDLRLQSARLAVDVVQYPLALKLKLHRGNVQPFGVNEPDTSDSFLAFCDRFRAPDTV